MAWSDIDFGLIQKGMITKGPAEVSFADYLNQFKKALVERNNILLTPLSDDVLVYEDVFFAGGVRIGSSNQFWTNFRELINGYNELWFPFEYYEAGVLTDVLNFDNYLITDADLEIAIGEEAYNILVNFNTLSNQEIFKASILQAFFTIYQKTAYVLKGIGGQNGGISGDDVAYNRVLFYRDKVQRWLQFENSDADPEHDPFESRSEAIGAARASNSSSQERIGSAIVSQQFFSSVNESAEETWGANGFWIDYFAYSIACRDLSGNLLNMNFKLGSSIVEDNWKRSNDTGLYSTFVSNFPFARLTDVEAETVVASSFQDDDYGTTQESYILGSKGSASGPYPAGAGSGSLFVRWSTKAFVNLNNNGLEFFI